MPRYILNLAVLVCIAVPNSGHSASVAGVWEATEKRNEHVDHHVLQLDERGAYEYVILSDDPQNPLRSDSGSFRSCFKTSVGPHQGSSSAFALSVFHRARRS